MNQGFSSFICKTYITESMQHGCVSIKLYTIWQLYKVQTVIAIVDAFSKRGAMNISYIRIILLHMGFDELMYVCTVHNTQFTSISRIFFSAIASAHTATIETNFQKKKSRE